MKTKIILIVLSALLTLSACTSTQYVALSSTDKKDSNVEVFLRDVQKPVKEYEIISYIETSGTIFTTKNQLLRGLKKKVDELGGDAVIDVHFFYIPWVLSSLPAVDGAVIKYK
ncbi:MAG: hypothetical protein ACP5DZ_09665 [Bacteroidales bacterium]